jgi:hypothetical protein
MEIEKGQKKRSEDGETVGRKSMMMDGAGEII